MGNALSHLDDDHHDHTNKYGEHHDHHGYSLSMADGRIGPNGQGLGPPYQIEMSRCAEKGQGQFPITSIMITFQERSCYSHCYKNFQKGKYSYDHIMSVIKQAYVCNLGGCDKDILTNATQFTKQQCDGCVSGTTTIFITVPALEFIAQPPIKPS